MTEPPLQETEILVIGGGLAGLCAGLELVRRGHEVVILHAHEERRIASWAAAGQLSPLPEDERQAPLTPLWVRALREYPSFLERLGTEDDIPLNRGCLYVALSGDESGRLVDLAVRAHEAGLTARPLTKREAKRFEPAVADDVASTLLLAEEAFIDHRALRRACLAAFCAAGGRVMEAEATGLVEEVGSVGGARVAGGWIRSRWTVNAAGAWAGRFLEGAGGPSLVRPVKGQMISLRPVERPVSRHLRGAEVYLVPRPDGAVFAGATSEDVGFAPGNTASAVAGLLAGAARLAPSLASAVIEETWWGFRPGTADALPIVGRDARPGLVHAAGLYRNGLLLAPLTGLAVADLVEGRALDTVWDGLSPARFDRARESGHR